MKPGRTWAALDVEYLTRDMEIVALRKEVGHLLVAAWWPRLIAACKDGDNLTAIVDIRAMANELGDPRKDDEVGAMLQRFVDRSLLSVASGCIDDGLVALRLVAGDDWQVNPGTQRSRRSRAKAADADDQGAAPAKKATRKKPAQKRKPAKATTDATPAQRDATPRNTMQPSRARTERDSETETDTDNRSVGSFSGDASRDAHARPVDSPEPLIAEPLASEPLTTRPLAASRRRGKLAPNIEAAVERLVDVMPPEDNGRRNFFELAYQGATEADFGDALGAIREVDNVHDRARYAHRTITNRLAQRAAAC